MILDKIVASTERRVDKAKAVLPLNELIVRLQEKENKGLSYKREPFAFEKNIRLGSIEKGKLSFICEVKKASPSKGIIAEQFPYLEIAKEYEASGAAAISVLTEPEFFQGADYYLSEVSENVRIPVLRKDFILEEYQIYEAKLIGADAVLLICSVLNTDKLKRYLNLCEELGLSALVEAHTEEEVYSAISAGARIIGVNNRNLKTFEVDLNHSIRLRRLVPPEMIFVAESGIKTPEDIKQLASAGVNAVLIGETLMRSKNIKEELEYLRGSLRS